MRLKTFVNETTKEPLFDAGTADDIVSKLEAGINAPYVSANKSTLGGEKNVSVIVNISLDPQKNWPNNIYQNSRYVQFHLTLPNVIEYIGKSYVIQPKFRKSRAKTVDDFVKKINQYIAKII